MSAPKRPIDEIEDEIAHTRAELSRTLDGLCAKLAPSRLIQKGGEMLDGLWRRWRGIEFGNVRFDPIALTMTGLGLGWLVAANTGLFAAPAANRGDTGAQTPEAASEPLRPAGAPLAETIERHPLLLGLAGLAAGAAIAALMPTSRREREIAVRARDDLWDKAEELGHRAAASIRKIGETPRHLSGDR